MVAHRLLRVNLWAGDSYHARTDGYLDGTITSRDPGVFGSVETGAAKLGVSPTYSTLLYGTHDELRSSPSSVEPGTGSNCGRDTSPDDQNGDLDLRADNFSL